MLATARLVGLDAEVRDKDGHSPNDCFLKCRNAYCAVARKSLRAERGSWMKLLDSARTNYEDSYYFVNNDGEVGDIDLRFCDQSEDTTSTSDFDSDSSIDEEYLDACECNDD